MISIEVKQTNIEESAYSFEDETGRVRKGVSRNQIAYAHIPGKAYPVEFNVSLRPEQPAYLPGRYFLRPDCFSTEKGRLVFKLRGLVPDSKTAGNG